MLAPCWTTRSIHGFASSWPACCEVPAAGSLMNILCSSSNGALDILAGEGSSDLLPQSGAAGALTTVQEARDVFNSTYVLLSTVQAADSFFGLSSRRRSQLITRRRAFIAIRSRGASWIKSVCKVVT